MVGPPGTDKSMLARRLAGLLPRGSAAITTPPPRRSDPVPARPRRHGVNRAGSVKRRGPVYSSGASARSAASTLLALRSAQLFNWSGPIRPTLKYFASGCAK